MTTSNKNKRSIIVQEITETIRKFQQIVAGDPFEITLGEDTIVIDDNTPAQAEITELVMRNLLKKVEKLSNKLKDLQKEDI